MSSPLTPRGNALFVEQVAGKEQPRYADERIGGMEALLRENAGMEFPTISTASVGAAGEALVATMLLSLGMEAAKPLCDNGVDLLAFSGKNYHTMVPIQVKTASSPQLTVERAWFKVPGLVLVYVWLCKGTGRYFVFDGLADVEAFLDDSAKTKSWVENGRWSLSSTNLGPTQTERLKTFENRWDKVSDRLKGDA